MRIINLIIFFLCIAINPSPAQKATKMISGQITADNHFVSGASLTLTNDKQMTVSDENGDFSLLLSDPYDTLVITHVGYKTKIVPLTSTTKTPLIITLESAQTKLDEVIINTGFQQVPKERLAGSFSFIDNKALNLQTGTNILDRINGMTTGVLFETNKIGNPNNVKVRGNSTINGMQDVLIIVDNFPYAGKIENINPDDIESISILKDASATSIWGARAGNGVIVITTKKGNFRQPLRVGANVAVKWTQKADLFYLPQISSADYIDVEQMLYAQGKYNSAISRDSRRHDVAFSPALEIFLEKKNGLISAADSASKINNLKKIDSRNDFNKYVYRNALNQQYTININGGSENLAYLFGVAYNKNISELHSNTDRLNLHFENTYKLSKKFQIGISGYYTHSENLSGMPAYNSIRIGSVTVPYLQLADTDGNPLSVNTTYRGGYTDTAGSGKLLNWKYYPLEDWKYDKLTTTLNDITANINMQYKIAKNLQLEAIYQRQNQEAAEDHLQDINSFYTRNLINKFTQVNGDIVSYVIPKGGIMDSYMSATSSYNFRTSLKYSHSWNRHTINGIAGWEVQQSENATKSYTRYGYNENPLSSTFLDYIDAYPLYQDLGGTGYIPYSNGKSHFKRRFVSYFTNLSYVLDSRYIFSLSARKDAANIFGLKINDKWKPLWSTGAAWNISKEKFYHQGWLPELKLRATYGYSGNVSLLKSALPTIYYLDPNPNSNFYTAARINSLNNPFLRWEQVSTFNIGIDFSLRDHTISGSVEYYVKKGSDLYGLSEYDYTAWGLNSTLERNVANMTGHGAEINLESRNIKGAFGWNTHFIFNYYSDKVTKYYHPDGAVYNPTSGTAISPLVGKPVFSILSYRFAGLDDLGNPQGYVGGKPSTDYFSIIYTEPKSVDDLVSSGPGSPKFYGFIGNEFSWNGFTLTINISYKLGYYFRKSTINYDALFNQGIGHSDFAQRWQKSGDEKNTDVPSMIYPNNSQRDFFYAASTATVSRADNIRLQFINLSYSFNNLYLKRSPFHYLEVYANAANLGILWKSYDGKVDPDYPATFRPSASFTIGTRINF